MNSEGHKNQSAALAGYRRLARWPGGRWLYARIICFKAPYFATIVPRFITLESGRCEIEIADRRRVHNHMGTVHAIALCNMAELSAGMMAEATVPPGMRWIPKGMTVEYPAKARGRMHALAEPVVPAVESDQGYTWPVKVRVRDDAGAEVFRAHIGMWVSPRKRK